MGGQTLDLSLEEELLILRFWTCGRDILLKFNANKLESIPGLKEAIEATDHLPWQIGWDDEEPQSKRGGSKAAER
jgi:hypothetical protein